MLLVRIASHCSAVTAPFSLLQYILITNPRIFSFCKLPCSIDRLDPRYTFSMQACRADASYPEPSSYANLYTYASSLAATETYHQQTFKIIQACDSSLVCSARLTLPVCKHILVGSYDVHSSTEQRSLILRSTLHNTQIHSAVSATDTQSSIRLYKRFHSI